MIMNRVQRILVCAALASVAVFGQAGSTLGVVTKIDAAARQIVLKTEAGAEITVVLQPTASFRRVAPGETDLRNASTIAITEISTGDRILARGKASDDQKSVAATLIVVMSKSDIANKQASERADWDKRGVTGNVTAVGGDQIAINVRGPGGVKPLIIIPGKDVVVRRYAPDSVKFVDAKPSTIAEIKTGDQVRARGDKSEDGTKMTADEIVSGSFRTIAATVNSIDTAQNQMRVTNLEGKKPVIVKVNQDSLMRKLPAQMAQALAARNRPSEDGASSNAGAGGGRGAPGGGRGGGRGGDLQQVVERAPSVTLADLKPGDAIIVLSTVGATSDQMTAITLLAGVEPILTAPGRKDMALGEWSLGADAGAAP
jgi:hypothetical protein